ncbi:MAG: hypothetical protein GY698_19970, partial [Actinomycetia bacterium]|nr:hypothetical protein [Actinomycetes bacterium]
EPTANEVQRAAKALGTQIVQQLTNYGTGSSMASLAASVTADPERRAALANDAAALHHPGQWSRSTIDYGQLGGLTADKTSIMVLVRQEIGLGDEVQLSESRTVDVRLERVEGVWVFDRVADAGGERVERPVDLSPEAAAVVDDPRIVMADSARWDIYRGHTSKTLLVLMADLADVTPYAALVLANGHPYHVFETERVSNHSIGRAIDIYRLGDSRVIDDHNPDSLIHEIVSWAFDREDVGEVGSPWALDGTGGRSFTNQVHHDHVHIGVYNLD